MSRRQGQHVENLTIKGLMSDFILSVYEALAVRATSRILRASQECLDFPSSRPEGCDTGLLAGIERGAL